MRTPRPLELQPVSHGVPFSNPRSKLLQSQCRDSGPRSTQHEWHACSRSANAVAGLGASPLSTTNASRGPREDTFVGPPWPSLRLPGLCYGPSGAPRRLMRDSESELLAG
eukprot:1387861-Pyramimonas_sp.AAC.1